MAHVRSAIRSAIATRLTGLTTTGARCYPSRVQPLADANLPCLRVYLDEEEIVAETFTADPLLDRRAVLRVECCAKAVASLDATLDTMVAEVEAAIAGGDGSFGGLLKSRPLPQSIAVDLDEGLEKPVGIATVTFDANYFTVASAPGTAV